MAENIEKPEKKPRNWMSKIPIFSILIVFLYVIRPRFDSLTTYLDEVYRIDGKNYILLQTKYSADIDIESFNRYELWEWKNGDESLYHQFPPLLENQPYWSKVHSAFFYIRQGWLYRWD